MNGIDGKTAGLVRSPGEYFEIQTHPLTLYAKRLGMELRVWLALPDDGLRYFFGDGAGAAAGGVAALFAAAAPSLTAKDHCASAFFPPIFASTITETLSPCSGWVT